MTLKLEGDLGILKMYLHNENGAASSRHLRLRDWIGKNVSGLKVKVKMSESPHHFNRYRNIHSDQALTVSRSELFELHATVFTLP